jgi:superfamily I DNA/RNA helicase
MKSFSDLSLRQFIEELLGATVYDLIPRFETTGWRYQGKTEIGCFDCETEYEVFRKPYVTTKGEYEYWAIVCANCSTCSELNVMNSSTKKAFRNWADSIDGVNSEELDDLQTNAPEIEVQRIVLQGFISTAEQIAIIEGAKGNSDISIEALAGTGKTTTLKMLADSKTHLKGTYVAFNKSIVDEAKSKFPSSVTCSTAHGLAYRAIGRDYASRLHSTQRLSFKQIAEWLEAPAFGFKSSISNHVLDPAQTARYVQTTVKNFCKSIDQEISAKHVEIPFIVKADSRNSNAFVHKVLPLANKVWNDLLTHQGFMRFSHDYYLKMWQLGKPTIGSDYILFDEAQDADPVMLDVVNSQSASQLIYCGDQYQAIYEWRGAKNALKMVHVDKHLWLTQSFRFGDAIAEEANRFLKLLGAPKMIKGLSSVNSKLREVANPDAILCRTNAGVISALMEEQMKGRLAAIIGRTQDLIEFAEACQQLIQGGRTGHPELAPFSNWESVLGFIAEYPEEAQEIKTMVELVQCFGTSKLISALDQVVTEKQADVVISTAHRAKGREWNNVRLQGDFLHVDDMDTEDLRLAYVAVTRAQNILDMSAWNSIEPIAFKKRTQQTSIVTLKNRPPIKIEPEVKADHKNGISSRLNPRN